MKILLINDHFKPIGGAEILMNSFGEELRKKGHQVRFFTSNALGESQDSDYSCFGSTAFYTPILQTVNPFAVKKLKQVLAEFQPNIIHVQLFLTQLSPLILSLLRNIPTVYYAVWYRTICPTGTKLLPNGQNCQQSLGKACLKNQCLPFRDWLPIMGQFQLLNRWKEVFDRVIVPSQAVREKFVANNFRVDGLIEHGIRPRTAPNAVKNTHPTIAFCGRLVKEKGATILIKAFHKVLAVFPFAQLDIIGDGPELTKLMQLAKRLNITEKITFRGFLSFEKAENILNKTWIQVIPSIWDEPFGLVAIDAMFRGTPIIASNTGGLGEFLEHQQTGVLVKSGEDQLLAQAIIQLLQNDVYRAKISKNALDIAHNQLTIERFTERFLGLYQELLA